MIIQCEKCGTKYRFDESLITGEGVWVRCSRCKNVFFQENPSMEQDVPPSDMIEDKEIVSAEIKEDLTKQEIEEEITGFDELPEGVEREEEPPLPSEEEITIEDDEEKVKKKKEKKRLWTPGKVLVYAVIVILVLGGVYLSLFPQIGKVVLDKVSLYMSTGQLEKEDKNIDTKMGGVDFIDVKGRFVKNWISGDIFVIEGVVVNKYDYPISKIKVRGKTLDTSQKVLDEVESYCGNLLTDEELSNLTEKEITGELSVPMGSDISNNNIAPKENIPFMIVFTNPSKESDEFIVELAKSSLPSE